MSQPVIPLAEFDTEMATTRRLLARVPTDRGEWKPHAKSFPLGHLAQLVAGMPGWIGQALRNTELDLRSFPGYSYQRTESLLEQFDGHVKASRDALAAITGDALDVVWSLKMGDKVLMARPRRDVVRESLSHLIHHRGQLTVYLRLIDVPIPSIYGPTADEPWGGPPG